MDRGFTRIRRSGQKPVSRQLVDHIVRKCCSVDMPELANEIGATTRDARRAMRIITHNTHSRAREAVRQYMMDRHFALAA